MVKTLLFVVSDLNSGILSLNRNPQKLGNAKIEVRWHFLRGISRLKTIARCFQRVLLRFVHRTQSLLGSGLAYVVTKTICKTPASFLPGVGKCLVSKAGVISGFCGRSSR